VPQRVRPAITAWPTIDVPLSVVDGARRRRASLLMARRLILCGTNLIVYDNVQVGSTPARAPARRGCPLTCVVVADDGGGRLRGAVVAGSEREGAVGRMGWSYALCPPMSLWP